jgi:hypothetical protein
MSKRSSRPFAPHFGLAFGVGFDVGEGVALGAGDVDAEGDGVDPRGVRVADGVGLAVGSGSKLGSGTTHALSPSSGGKIDPKVS